MPDLSLREIAILLPITAAVLWMGIAPGVFQEPMKPAIASIVARLDGRALATLPTDMTLTPGVPTLAAPAAAAEAHH